MHKMKTIMLVTYLNVLCITPLIVEAEMKVLVKLLLEGIFVYRRLSTFARVCPWSFDYT